MARLLAVRGRPAEPYAARLDGALVEVLAVAVAVVVEPLAVVTPKTGTSAAYETSLTESSPSSSTKGSTLRSFSDFSVDGGSKPTENSVPKPGPPKLHAAPSLPVA